MSTSTYLTVTFENPSATNDGYFWVGFEVTENNALLKVECPAAAKTMCGGRMLSSLFTDNSQGELSVNRELGIIASVVTNRTSFNICNDCPALSTPSQGSISLSSGQSYASEATYSCTSGYKIVGDAIRVCQAIGTWSGTEPSCEPLVIGDPCNVIGDCTGINDVDCRNDGSGLQCLCVTGYEGTVGGATCTIVECSDLTDPTDGSVALSSGKTYESVATYSCDLGYLRVGSETRICQADKTWTNTAPTCQLVDCGNLANPSNGAVTTPDGTTYDETATYTCDAGYDITGGTTRTCQADGNWDGSEPTCVIKDCGLGNIANGQVQAVQTTYGSSGFVNCDAGYTGGGFASCLDTGLWGGADECVPVDCGSLATPSNGDVSTPDGTTFGETATYTCDAGYDLTGSATRICQDDGNWDGSEPTCVIRDCGNLVAPSNGAVTTPDGTTFGETALYTCNAGYDISGSATRTCQADGSWDGSEPTCVIKDCGNLGNPPDGTVDTSAGTTYGSEATFTCNTGYTMNGVGTSTCQANGQWDNLDPVCLINDCGNIPSPSNGAVSLPDGTTYGEIATYTCDQGYDISGSASRTCQADGTWEGSDPTCNIADCGQITAPNNGNVEYSNGATTYQEIATFTCDSGYDLNGDGTRTCQADGTWSGAMPVCDVRDCGALASPTNGAVATAGGTTYDQTATYTCATGYGIIGATTRRCQADGQWEGSPPTCQLADCSTLTSPTNGAVSIGPTTYNAVANYTCDTGYDLVGDQSRTCQQDGTWSGSPPTCQIKDCGSPHNLQNGHYSTPAGTRYGASASYSCRSGYTLSGSASVPCLSNGSWDSLPTCNPDCGSPPPIENGDFITPTDTSLGATVTYTCSSGYNLKGSASIVCQDHGIWTSPPGCQLDTKQYEESCSVTEQCLTERATCRATICQCAASGEFYDISTDTCQADCGSLTDPTNGVVTLPESTVEGQVAEYSCNVGYALDDITLERRTCLNTGEWNAPAPLCVVGCPIPIRPANGYVDWSGGRAVGNTITYSCDEGYMLVGLSSRVCRKDPMWDGNDPECLIKCSILSGIEDGSVDMSGGYWEGSIATYVCNKDYALVGTSTRTCQVTGHWNGVAPTCIFAIFPDVLLVIGALLIFLVVLDVFAIAFCLYLRHKKKKRESKPPPTTNEFDDISDIQEDQGENAFEEKPLEKLENGIPPTTLITAGPARASFKKTRNSKVAPEDAKKRLPQIPRKPPVPKADRSSQDRIPKPKPLPKGAYRNNRGFGPKIYGPEPIRFKNETVPFVPLETSDPPPSTQQQQVVEEMKEEKIADVEKLLKEGGMTSGSNDIPKSSADEDQISINHLTNPVFDTDDKLIMMDYDAHEDRKPITKLEDAQETLKGRINLPALSKAPDRSAVVDTGEGEKQMSEESRRHLKNTMSAYSPVLGNQQRPFKV